MTSLLQIDPAFEEKKISEFIKSTLAKSKFQNVILAVSGGIDSATSLNVIKEIVPIRNIFVAHLYYFEKSIEQFKTVIGSLGLLQENILLSPIKDQVDIIAKSAGLESPQNDTEKLRLGNIMARVRMIMIYDFAKKHHALVCGTENRSEYWLGYFTRFGDAASDFEPLHHLYKTQVRELAKYLKVPEIIRNATPTAGLWDTQTDEGELGFSYAEADPVLYLYFDEKHSLQEIKNRGYSNVKQIIETALKNGFKHEVPYHL